MRATAPTNVSPAWRAPTWVAAKGQEPSIYFRPNDRLETANTSHSPKLEICHK